MLLVSDTVLYLDITCWVYLSFHEVLFRSLLLRQPMPNPFTVSSSGPWRRETCPSWTVEGQPFPSSLLCSNHSTTVFYLIDFSGMSQAQFCPPISRSYTSISIDPFPFIWITRDRELTDYSLQRNDLFWHLLRNLHINEGDAIRKAKLVW